MQKKMDLILEKGTELGISEFIFFFSKNSSIKKISKNKVERMKNITISAIKQCKRLDLPNISIVKDIKKVKLQKNSFFGDIRNNATFLLDILEKPIKNSILFFIGPEKGFSKEEMSFLEKQAKGVSLSNNTLRSETAAISFSSIISHIT